MNLDDEEKITENYFETVKKHFDDETILIGDDSDIAKVCNKKLEGLCKVRDDSTGEIVDGYWYAGASALTANHQQPIPVYSRVYSSVEDGYISNNAETIKSFEFLTKHFSKKNIRALDRGYDASYVFDYFMEHEETFVVRMNDRKQNFGYEKFLVRTLQSIRNLDLLLTIAIGYIGVLSEKVNKSIEVYEIIEASKRLYGLSKFTFYAIADGLFEILGKLYTGISMFFTKPPNTNQLYFPGWF